MTKSDKLRKRTVQLIGFGLASILLIVRIAASLLGKDSGITEVFIAGLIGVGVSAEFRVLKRFKDK